MKASEILTALGLTAGPLTASEIRRIYYATDEGADSVVPSARAALRAAGAEKE